MNAPETTSDNRFFSFVSKIIKDSENIRITYAQKYFKITLESAYFISQKMKLKLAKQAEKEPRKARFPWDLGLLFVKPTKMH